MALLGTLAATTALTLPARAEEETQAGDPLRAETETEANDAIRTQAETEAVDPMRADEVMVVHAARASRVRSTIPAATTVLDGQDLDRSISTSLDDALRFVPSLQLIRQGARGGVTQLSMRGLEPNQVVVLIDGVRLNDPTNSRGGSFDPTTLALVDIERVEIVRGPLSTVYGSDALAGAINIVTRRAAPDAKARGSVRVRGGRFHTGNAIAQAETGVGEHFGLTLGAALDTFRDPNSDGGYDGANLKARLSTILPQQIELDVFTRLHEGSARGFPESSGGSELATLREMEDRDVREILVGLTLSRSFEDRGEIELRASRADRREDIDSPGIVSGSGQALPPTRSGNEYTRWEIAASGSVDAPSFEIAGTRFATRFVAGGEAIWEDGESDTFVDFSGSGTGPFVPLPFFDDRRTVGVYGELEERIGPYLTLSGSLRFDTTPDEQDRFSPAAGVELLLPGTPVTLFASYGEGFKRPSFYALSQPFVGNPALRVEKSRSYEIGSRATWQEGRLRGQLSYFEIKVRDPVTFVSAPPRLVNANPLVSRGVELELGWQALEWLDLRGGVTFNYTNFSGTGGPDPENRPAWRGFAAVVMRPTETLELELRASARSSFQASSFQTDGRVDTLNGTERIDVRAAWTPLPWMDLFVEIENLTNATPREAVGFESPGIAPRAGAVLRF